MSTNVLLTPFSVFLATWLPATYFFSHIVLIFVGLWACHTKTEILPAIVVSLTSKFLPTLRPYVTFTHVCLYLYMSVCMCMSNVPVHVHVHVQCTCACTYLYLVPSSSANVVLYFTVYWGFANNHTYGHYSVGNCIPRSGSNPAIR